MADALGSGPSARKGVEVQILSLAPGSKQCPVNMPGTFYMRIELWSICITSFDLFNLIISIS